MTRPRDRLYRCSVCDERGHDCRTCPMTVKPAVEASTSTAREMYGLAQTIFARGGAR